MTKNEIIAYFKRYGHTCSYCGREHKMYVHHITMGEIAHHGLITKGIMLVPQKGG